MYWGEYRKKNTIFFGLFLTVPTLVFGLYCWYEKNKNQLPVYGDLSKESNSEKVNQHQALSFLFFNQEGNIINESYIKNKIWVGNYFFTHCGTICPLMMRNLKLVQENFMNDTAVQMLSFTVDPERDTARRLLDYGNAYDIIPSKWKLLTGDKKDLYRFARNDLKIIATSGDGGTDDFIHSEKAVLIDKNQQIRGYYDATDKHQIEQLIKDILKLKKE